MHSQYFKCSVAICGYCIGQFRSDILFSFKKLFSNITFLLIIWEFYIAPWLLSGLPRSTQSCACPKTEGKGKKNAPSPFCVAHILLEHGQTPSGQPLKAVPSSPHQKPSIVKSSASPSVSQCLRLLFGGFLFRLEGGKGIDTEAFTVSFSLWICSSQYHRKRSFSVHNKQ